MICPDWDWTLIAVSASFHGVAILTTLFRLWYRWYTGRIWWDDAWAVLAFLADVACLIATLIERPISGAMTPHFFDVGNWILSFAYPILRWATRISILASIVQLSHPEGTLRRIALGIGALFGILGTTILGQRLRLCAVHACLLTKTVLITQTTTDCFADVLLSALPLWLLRSVKLSRKRKILISSVLSAGIVVNVVTVVQAVAQSRLLTSGSIIFEHVKVACSMIVCNLLVITTFVYRILYKGEAGLEDSMIEFTTIDVTQEWSSGGASEQKPSALTTGSSTWSFRGGN